MLYLDNILHAITVETTNRNGSQIEENYKITSHQSCSCPGVFLNKIVYEIAYIFIISKILYKQDLISRLYLCTGLHYTYLLNASVINLKSGVKKNMSVNV